MKIILAIGGFALILGTGGLAYYFLYDRTVETGVFQGRKWRVMRRGNGQFCPEIEIVGFAGFQKLDCHDTIGTAKGEAIEALLNIDSAQADASPAMLQLSTPLPGLGGLSVLGLKAQFAGPDLPPLP